MKKIITTLSICALAFVACNDNKDKPPPPAAATATDATPAATSDQPPAKN